jgi:hypothetical protein
MRSEVKWMCGCLVLLLLASVLYSALDSHLAGIFLVCVAANFVMKVGE